MGSLSAAYDSTLSTNATYERKYPKGLFNKGVRVLNEDHVGHIMKETDDKSDIWEFWLLV
jgi:hypothetical protein